MVALCGDAWPRRGTLPLPSPPPQGGEVALLCAGGELFSLILLPLPPAAAEQGEGICAALPGPA